jgi:hypothetical protein
LSTSQSKSRTQFGIALSLVVAACGGSSPYKGPTGHGDVTGPSLPLEAIDQDNPAAPGAANLHLACAPTRLDHPCDATSSEMSITGDRISDCRFNAAGNVAVTFLSAVDASDRISINFKGYGGPGRYGAANELAIAISDSVRTPSWQGASCEDGAFTGPAHDAGQSAGAPDTCGSPDACQVEVIDADPSAPFPRELKFVVSCTDLCVNGTTIVCTEAGGPVEFSVSGMCAGS